MSITSRINEMSTHIEQAYDELQGLGADLTNVNKNIENISSVLDDIYDSMPQVSGEGTSLTLDDTRVGKIKSTLKGNTSQDGTPTPTSPIPVNVVSGDNEINVVGKNLIGLGTILHAYRDNSTGKIQVNANCVGYYFPTSVLPDTITFSCVGGNRANISYYNSVPASAVQSVDFSNTNTLPRTISVNKTYSYIFIQLSYNTLDVTNIQLEKGSSASTYEPYQGNTYNINLGVKNLWNSEDMKIGYLNQSGSYPVTNSSYPNARYIIVPLYKGQSLTTYGDTMYGSFRMRYIDIETNQIVGTVAEGNNGGYCTSNVTYQGSFNNGTVTATKDILLGFFDFEGTFPTSGSYKITYGTKIQAISPTPIELCKIPNTDYEDTFLHDKVNDKWYLHKEIGKVVLNGSESWFAETQRYRVDNIIQGKTFTSFDGNTPLAYCEGFKWGNGTSSNFVYGAFWYTSNGLNLSLQKDENPNATTLANFKTWLGSNNPKVYYALATPTNTEITYQPLIDQLNLLEKAQSKENQTNISQVNNDLPFIISASALKEWSV